MDEKQFNELVEKVGVEAAKKIKKEMDGYEAKMKSIAEEAVKQGGGLTQEQYEEHKEAAELAIKEIKGICEKQGLAINDLLNKVGTTAGAGKSIAACLKENEAELLKVYENRGTKQFVVNVNAKGEWTMAPLPATQKAAGPTGTVDGLGGVGTVASITQALSSATLLRLGGNSPIIGQYRNNPFLFPLTNQITAGTDQIVAMWFEETPKQGSAATVPEGATKPLVQYAYELKSANYKKKAQLINFTEEFHMDFPRLESDIMGKGSVDLFNLINSDVQTNILAAATPYNTATEFIGDSPLDFINDYDAIAAMAAQVDNATYGSQANSAIMSTFKKRRMGVTKSTQGEYLNRPGDLDNVEFIGNPGMSANGIVVGDLSQYNIIWRGGLIVRIGYNGTDFAENKFSVVMEQFYYDYISEIRKSAIVKGPDFSDVKTALAAASTALA